MQIDDRLVTLSPGMAVTVEIKTGSRRIIEYLLSPIKGLNADAFSETGGGTNTYQFARGNGAETITKNATSGLGANGEIDFGTGIATNQLWFLRNGNDLQIDIMGTTDHATIAGWFGSANSQFSEIKLSDGSMLDSQLNQLVQAMATYSTGHTSFNPTTVSQAPADTTLQAAITAAWHH